MIKQLSKNSSPDPVTAMREVRTNRVAGRKQSPPVSSKDTKEGDCHRPRGVHRQPGLVPRRGSDPIAMTIPYLIYRNYKKIHVTARGEVRTTKQSSPKNLNHAYNPTNTYRTTPTPSRPAGLPEKFMN